LAAVSIYRGSLPGLDPQNTQIDFIASSFLIVFLSEPVLWYFLKPEMMSDKMIWVRYLVLIRNARKYRQIILPMFPVFEEA
jgi:hypothetical protein